MSTSDSKNADTPDYDPKRDIQLQALHHVDELVQDESHEIVAARLWALFWATTARLRYRGATRVGFVQAFETACNSAELALQQDIDEAQQRLDTESRSPAILTQHEAPRQLM